MKYTLVLLLPLLFFSACAPKPSPKLSNISYGQYQEVLFEEIPSWKDEDFRENLELFNKTCARTHSQELYHLACSHAEALKLRDNSSAKAFFEQNFTPFVSLSKESLATGYYEPRLEGSGVKTQEFSYPVYGVPDDLLRIELADSYKSSFKRPLRGRLAGKRVQPYFTREQINRGGLKELDPICYTNDRVALFFLQVQGSGSVRFEDGSMLYLGYADQNGHPYVSIGKEMIKRGLIEKEKISLQSIRAYLHEHPSQMDEILNLNPSYVFFEVREHSASGSLGLILEKERSVAVDRENIPLGMPLFIRTKDPLSKQDYEKMVFAHDTGGAIKGEARIDIFFGAGKEAREKAGTMKEALDLWILVPNDYLSKQKIK